MIRLTVIIPAHNPHRERLARTLAGLHAQDLSITEWELILVDNASEPALDADLFDLAWHPAGRVVREPELGLTPARIRGFREAQGELCVLVDDDNILRPDYLSHAVQFAAKHSDVGVFGGKSLPEFEAPPPPWLDGLEALLALRDDGDRDVVANWDGTYPLCAPIGAGMVIRRSTALAWVAEIETDPRRRALDRAGNQLVSGGDNDIVISVMKGGAKTAYFPELVLTHLIPVGRCDASYLVELNRAIAKSWMQLLTMHGINPWSPVPGWSLPLRKAKAWLTHRAWSGPAARIRWAGACGHFEGRVRAT